METEPKLVQPETEAEEQPQPLVRVVSAESEDAAQPQSDPEDPALPVVQEVNADDPEAAPETTAGGDPATSESPSETETPQATEAVAGLDLDVEEPTDTEENYEDEEEEQPVLIAAGVMDIDKKLGGGIPLDTLTLVEGDPESGKSVVIQQLAYGALKEGLKVSIFLSEQTVREFLNQMEDLGMQITDHYLVGRLSLYGANLRVDQERAERLMQKLIKFIEKSEDSDVFIVDSITPLLFQFDARYVLSFLATCRDIAATGRTIMVTLHSYAINESLRLRAGSIVDSHLRLSIEELGAQVVRTLEISKIRGAVKTIGNSVSFSVEQSLGLKSIPISKTKG
jgi:flagellar protein FlaH